MRARAGSGVRRTEIDEETSRPPGEAAAAEGSSGADAEAKVTQQCRAGK